MNKPMRHRRHRYVYTVALVLAVCTTGILIADPEELATLRKSSIVDAPAAPRMMNVENNDIKRKRNYPMQPPTIPHKTENYAVNLNANKCMVCHSRRNTAESQAPMVSVTHYMDRDGNFLAEVSPRRYFCNQCHVPQVDGKPLVDNTFQDVDALLTNNK